MVASKLFLEKGYSNTSIKNICKELGMSPGNVTFYFPTKDHLLAELVDQLCGFQWKIMEEEAAEDISSILALCLELTAMAAVCESNDTALDFYRSTYTSPLCLEIIRKNDMKRAKDIFKDYRPDWNDDHYAEAEILVSGIEYATLMAAGASVPLETRIAGALDVILSIFGVPDEMRATKIKKVFAMDYLDIGNRTYTEFKKYVETSNKAAIKKIIGR